MTRLEYDLIRDQEPQLRLPHWDCLLTSWKDTVFSYNQQQLFAGRTAFLLRSEIPLLADGHLFLYAS